MVYISQTYVDLINKFPDELDPNRDFQDVSIDTFPLVQQFNSLYNNHDFDGIRNLISAHPILKDIIITAENLQYMYDMCIANQRFYLSDIQQYLINLVQPKGDYQPNIKYNKYNTVQYSVGGIIETFICLDNTTPIGTIPTNTAYWSKITQSGATFIPSVNQDGILTWSNDKGLPNPPPKDVRGVSGSGLTPRGGWTNVTQYYQYDLVAWENKLYYALRDNINKVPTANLDDWIFYLELSNIRGSTTDTAEVQVSQSGYVTVNVRLDQIVTGNLDSANESLAASIKTVKDLNLKKADKSEVVELSLLSTNWVGLSAPYTYSLTVVGVTSISNQELLPSLTITQAQLESLQSANIVDGGQGVDTIFLIAYGDKPTIDIPIRVIKRGD